MAAVEQEDALAAVEAGSAGLAEGTLTQKSAIKDALTAPAAATVSILLLTDPHFANHCAMYGNKGSSQISLSTLQTHAHAELYVELNAIPYYAASGVGATAIASLWGPASSTGCLCCLTK